MLDSILLITDSSAFEILSPSPGTSVGIGGIYFLCIPKQKNPGMQGQGNAVANAWISHDWSIYVGAQCPGIN
jgi:hypothetical protein